MNPLDEAFLEYWSNAPHPMTEIVKAAFLAGAAHRPKMGIFVRHVKEEMTSGSYYVIFGKGGSKNEIDYELAERLAGRKLEMGEEVEI